MLLIESILYRTHAIINIKKKTVIINQEQIQRILLYLFLPDNLRRLKHVSLPYCSVFVALCIFRNILDAIILFGILRQGARVLPVVRERESAN